jgi:hypothetical protein
MIKIKNLMERRQLKRLIKVVISADSGVTFFFNLFQMQEASNSLEFLVTRHWQTVEHLGIYPINIFPGQFPGLHNEVIVQIAIGLQVPDIEFGVSGGLEHA